MFEALERFMVNMLQYLAYNQGTIFYGEKERKRGSDEENYGDIYKDGDEEMERKKIHMKCACEGDEEKRHGRKGMKNGVKAKIGIK